MSCNISLDKRHCKFGDDNGCFFVSSCPLKSHYCIHKINYNITKQFNFEFTKEFEEYLTNSIIADMTNDLTDYQLFQFAKYISY